MTSQSADDIFMRAAQVRQRYGNVSHMWIERRLKNDPTFPRPVYFGRQRFWRICELVEWERSMKATQEPTRKTHGLMTSIGEIVEGIDVDPDAPIDGDVAI